MFIDLNQTLGERIRIILLIATYGKLFNAGFSDSVCAILEEGKEKRFDLLGENVSILFF
jgi:hypothetical protein